MENKYVLGLDPGIRGAFVILKDGKYHYHSVMPVIESEIDLGALRYIFSMASQLKCVAWLEKSHAFPGMSAASQFKVGYNFGILEALLVGYDIPYNLVSPATWTKEVHKGVKPNLPSKAKSLLIAKRLFPDLDTWIIKNRNKIYHDGLVDALLLAYYGLKRT